MRRGAKTEGVKGRRNETGKDGKEGEREGKEAERRSGPAPGHTLRRP